MEREGNLELVKESGLELVTRAAAFAGAAHRDQLRKEGNEPYINHPLRVAEQAARVGLSPEAIAAALLHDVVEDTPIGQAEIEKAFPPRVAHVVKLMTQWWPDDAPAAVKDVGKPVYYGAIAGDAEAIAVKLLDRADNLMSMVTMLPRKRDWALRYYRKTMRDVAPLAAQCEYPGAVAVFEAAAVALQGSLTALGLLP